MLDSEKSVQNNIGLVHACAKRFKNRGIEYDDLFQAGCLGLVKAAKAFDEERGVRFSTYAVPVILGEMKRLFRDGGSVKVGRRLKELSVRALRVCSEIREREGREPTIQELADALGVETAQAALAINATQQPLSLTIRDEEGGGQLDIPIDSPDEKISERLALRQVMAELGDKERDLIILRFFKRLTQSQAGEELGMSQVQVSRKERLILSDLRKKLIGGA